MRAIVPRVIGATAAAQAVKARTPRGTRRAPWTKDEVIDNIRERLPNLAWIAERVVAWADTKEGMTIAGGRGADYPSFSCVYDTHQTKVRERTILVVWGGPNDYAKLELRLRRLRRNPAYRGAAAQEQLRSMVTSTGVPQLTEAYEKRLPRPNVAFSGLTPEHVERVLSLCDDWCQTIRAQPPNAAEADEDDAADEPDEA